MIIFDLMTGHEIITDNAGVGNTTELRQKERAPYIKRMAGIVTILTEVCWVQNWSWQCALVAARVKKQCIAMQMTENGLCFAEHTTCSACNVNTLYTVNTVHCVQSVFYSGRKNIDEKNQFNAVQCVQCSLCTLYTNCILQCALSSGRSNIDEKNQFRGNCVTSKWGVVQQLHCATPQLVFG